MEEIVFINRFIINHTKIYDFHTPTLVIFISDKIMLKMRYSLFKITTFNEETTLHHAFFSSNLQCLPPGNPRILYAWHRLLANHSLSPTGNSYLSFKLLGQ